MIGASKGVIPQRDRKYYRYDKNVAIAYDCICTIDTMHIMVELSDNIIKYLLRTYEFSQQKLSEDVTKYFIKSKGIVVIVFAYIDGLGSKGMIQLQRQITVNQLQSPLWHFICYFLSNNCIKYYIRRLDIAFDFKFPINRSIALSRNTAMKRDQYAKGVMIGSTKSSSRTATVCHYDRNAKEQAKNCATDKEIYEYANRFEVKLFLKEKDEMTFSNINHEIILERLRKEILVVNYKDVDELSQSEKTLITDYKKEGNESLFKGQKKAYNRIRERLVKNRESLEGIYENNQESLYDFLSQEENEEANYVYEGIDRSEIDSDDATTAAERVKSRATFKPLTFPIRITMNLDKILNQMRTIKLINCSAKRNVKLYLYLYKQKT